MPKEIIISVSGDQSRIAIVEDGELVELYVENPENVRTIGDIYLGRIRRILPGIKAAFVDVGQKQDAFLHFSDLADNVPALLELADGRVKDPVVAKALPTEPPSDADLEVETAEEQIATRRRRELSRRPQKSKAEPDAAAPSEESKAKEEVQKEAPRRRRAPRAQQTQAPSDVPPAPAILPPDAAAAGATEPSSEEKAPQTETKQTERPRRRRGRRRGQGQSREGASPETNGDETAAKGVEEKRRKPRSSPKQTRKSEDGKGRAQEANLAPSSSKPAESKEQQTQDDTSTATSAPRLSPSSRFVIDLTGGSSSEPARRREEEEEEEERTSSRRSRRKGRSTRGGRRRSGSSGDKSNNGSSDSSEETAADNETPPQDFLKQDQRIVVKIIKEPISTKGPRVSTDVSLAGRFLVLVPAADYVAVSKRIESAKERRRLRALARSLLPEGLGLIVRTVAEGRDAKTLDADLQLLLDKWRRIEDQLRKRPKPPTKLYEDVNMVSSIIRDLFSEDYDRIVVDDQKAYQNIKTYVDAVAPQMADKVQLHQRKESVFRAYKIEGDIRAAFESRVSLPGGGYLIIEHTEAMHVVDVNSGRAGKGLSQEKNALKVNLEAANEIAKQLRLRDLGGIICVDFIDMRSNAYRKKLFDELKRAFRRDRAITKLLPMSDFGVVEITRQRLRPSITTTLDVDDIGPETDGEEIEEIHEKAPRPRPERTASEVVEHLERWLMRYRDEVSEMHRKRPVLIRVHPFLSAYLQRGIPSLLTRWRFKSRLKLKLDVDENAEPLSFTVRDEKSGKNLTRKYDPDR